MTVLFWVDWFSICPTVFVYANPVKQNTTFGYISEMACRLSSKRLVLSLETF